MSKKDYQAIARAVYTASAKDPAFAGETRNGVVFELCATFKADNPCFDRARFVEACETGRCKGMSALKPYNGHHCWNCWNVALWIDNDEGLYRFALDCKARLVEGPKRVGPPSNGLAARRFMEGVGTKTPDGGRYTFKAVRAALTGLE